MGTVTLIGGKVEAARMAKGMNLEQLAQATGAGYSTVRRACKWKAPKVKPETAAVLAQALGVGIDEITV